MYYEISGYFLDSRDEPFEGYVVKDSHDMVEGGDASIFYYGLDEVSIQHAIDTGEPIDAEFVITGYKKCEGVA